MRRLQCLVLSMFALAVFGCGEKGPELIGLSGEVTYNGEPIKDGEISFSPDVGTAAPPTSTPITNGKFQLPSKWALNPGTYNVAIRAYKPSENDGKLPGSGLDRPPSPGGIPMKDQLLPAKFNTKSTIEKLTVTKGQAAITKKYELKD